MMKQIWNLGAMALLAATIFVGCSDSVVDTTTSGAAATYDAYDATVLDETQMSGYEKVPTEAAMLADSSGEGLICSGDSLRGGEPGGKGRGGRGGRGGGHEGEGERGRGHGRDGGIGDIAPLGIRNYRAAAAQLNLTAQQDSLFRVYLSDLRDCAGEAAAAYRTARETAFAPYKGTVDSIRAAVKAGTITRDDAKARLDSVRAQFEAALAPLNETLRASVTACRSNFEAAVEAMLSTEQREVWLTLK